MRVALVNRFAFHETYADRLAAAAVRAGHDAAYFGRSPISACRHQRIRVDMPRRRGIAPPIRAWWLDARDRRAHWPHDADLLIDLYLARSLWVLDGAKGQVRVVHRTDELLGTARRRWRLRQIVEHGAVVVVHTKRARELLQQVVPAEAVILVPHFGPDAAPGPARPPGQPLQLLFVGDARPEKGLDLLLGALDGSPLAFAVRHVGGHMDAGIPGECRHGRSTVTRVPRISDAELTAEYHTADLVVCPYLPRYADTGAASSVISEALTYGAPLLVPEDLRAILPAGYAGAVTVPTVTARAIADALHHNADDPVPIGMAARADGPRLVPTADSYFAQLVTHAATAHAAG